MKLRFMNYYNSDLLPSGWYYIEGKMDNGRYRPLIKDGKVLRFRKKERAQKFIEDYKNKTENLVQQS